MSSREGSDQEESSDERERSKSDEECKECENSDISDSSETDTASESDDFRHDSENSETDTASESDDFRHDSENSDTDTASESDVTIEENISFELMKTAFQSRVREYVIKNNKHIDPKCFLEDAYSHFERETTELLREYKFLKIHTSFKVCFIKMKVCEGGEIKEEELTRFFNTKTLTVTESTGLEHLYSSEIVEKTLNKVSEYQLMGSGWTLKSVEALYVNNCKCECFNGSSYIKLPSTIEVRKATINVKNMRDQKCFLWSVLAALHHNEFDSHVNRTSNYKKYETELNMKNIEYPVSVSQIERFENQNSQISINVYAFHETPLKNAATEVDGNDGNEIIADSDEMSGKIKPKKGFTIYPIRLTKEVKDNHIHLLLISAIVKNGKSNESDTSSMVQVNTHYCLIKNLSRLLQSQLSVSNRRMKYFCDRCLNYFYSTDKLDEHIRICIEMNSSKIVLPSEDEKWIEFTNYKNQLDVPYVLYADIESILEPISETNETNATPKGSYQRHVAHSIAFYFQSKHPDVSSFYKSYNGLDCISWFCNELKQIGKMTLKEFLNIKSMIPLTQEQLTEMRSTKKCFICKLDFTTGDIKVVDHCHMSGNFRGVAHQECNLNFKESRIIPVFFHNLKYDEKFLIEEIASCGRGKVDIIPITSENYISFTKLFHKDELFESDEYERSQFDFKDNIKFRFVDSYRFLPESLAKLASNLTTSELSVTRSEWNELNDEQFKLITQKGIYPYDYVDSTEKLLEKKLPPIEFFYNKLNESDISVKDYESAKLVWDSFNISSLLEYTNLYLKTDVLLLTDIVENFRRASKQSYDLDPAHYFTLPGYSWDCMLKYTKVKLELISDGNIDQLMFVERGRKRIHHSIFFIDS